jgi:hypothetical protein
MYIKLVESALYYLLLDRTEPGQIL